MARRPVLPALAALAAAALLAACGSAPPRAPDAGPAPAPRPARPAAPDRDGGPASPPPDLHRVPDAEPRWEPLRSGGPNKPYEVLGVAYTPLAGDPPLRERGLASWYGNKFHGRPTATGEAYNMYAMTAAHKTMPLPSYARVRNPANGREVVVRVNDRGPFHSDRVIDLSYTAAYKLGLLGGVAPVEVERITYEAIRTGAWRAPTPAELPELPSASAIAMATAANEAVADAAARPAPGAAPATAGPAADPIAALLDARTGPPGAGPRRPAEGPRTAAPAAVGAAAATTTTAPGLPALPRAAAEPVPDDARAAGKAARGWWLQLGAFRQHDGAVRFREQVLREADWLGPLLTVFDDRRLHRLQAGPFSSRADAHQAAERLRGALQLAPAVVERR